MREDFCVAAASRELGRPVKWIEDRNEHLVASGQAREEMVQVELAVKADGTFLGMKAKLIMDAGAYPNVPFVSAMFVGLIQLLLPGPYRMKGYRFESSVISTNKAAYVAYRGPWEMETWVRERLVDIVAHELGMDSAEIRRKNMMLGSPDDRLITGLTVKGISSRESLDRALECIDYEGFREEQEAARAQGRYLGIGFATFIEAAPGPAEMRPGGGMFGGERAKVAVAARRSPGRDNGPGAARAGPRDDPRPGGRGRDGCPVRTRQGRARRHPADAVQRASAPAGSRVVDVGDAVPRSCRPES